MKQILTYRFFLKGIVFLLLIGQLWTNVGLYCNWFQDAPSEFMELCSSEDSESEEKTKKEKDHKFKIELYASMFDVSIAALRFSHSVDFQSLEHPEITTPPPEPSLFLS